jgi:hypothetical protein
MWQPAIPLTFNTFQTAVKLYTMHTKKDAVLDWTRAITGATLLPENLRDDLPIDADEALHHNPQQNIINAALNIRNLQLNMTNPAVNTANAATNAAANSAVYAMLASALSPEDLAQIQPTPEGNDAHGNPNVCPIGVNANLLWAACVQHSRGAVADMCGSDLHDQIEQWTWPTISTTGLPMSLVDQVIRAIAQLRHFVSQAVVIADQDYPFTTALAVKKFTNAMPARFANERKAYRRIVTLAALQTEATADAKILDSTAPTGMDALMAPLLAQHQGDSTALFKALAAAMTGGHHGGNTNYVRYTRERLMDKSAGKPSDSMHTYCLKHGWSTHSDAQCYAQHPELTPPGYGGGRNNRRP